MVRTQYITISELNEILGVDTYTESDLVKVYEASEVIEYYVFNPTWQTPDTPKNIKLATAYQLKYMEINDLFDEYEGGEFTLGKFSTNKSGSNTTKPLSNKARQYLIGYINRLV